MAQERSWWQTLFGERGTAPHARLLDDNSSTLSELHAAAERGDTVGVAAALKSGISPDALLALHAHEAQDDDDGRLDPEATNVRLTPLCRAVFSDHVEVAQLLLDVGADPNARATDGDTALHWASMGGAVNCIEFLLARGANINARGADGASALFRAAVLDRPRSVEVLVAHGASPSSTNGVGDPVLVFSAALGVPLVVDALIRCGAPIEARTADGETALLRSLSRGRRLAALLLLHAGADPHVVDGNGRTVLHHAAYGGLVGMARRLVDKHGCDVDVAAADGETPLHVATRRGFRKLRTMLLERGANLSAAMTDGTTVESLEQGATEMLWLNEELRLLRALPREIPVVDMWELSKVMDGLDLAPNKDAQRARVRMLLEDLVFKYRDGVSEHDTRARASVSGVIAAVEQFTPGEDEADSETV